MTSCVYAISDLHIDYPENLEFVRSWSNDRYRNDVLIVAGDVTDNMQLLEATLRQLKKKFADVFFVPGNHELWIRPKENMRDSVAKFRKINAMCERIGVHIKPHKVALSLTENVWIVPLQSWYSTPEDDYADTLYISHPAVKEDLRTCEAMWMDNHMTKWPSLNGATKSKFFASFNEKYINRHYDAPVITFSHVVPRRELIRANGEDMAAVNKERHQCGLGDAPKFSGMIPGFNFTRYAGSNFVDKQLRQIGAKVHVYGHMHRNRDRTVDGVQYISHCLGNVKEQRDGYVYGLKQWMGPKQVWPSLAKSS